MYPKGDLITDCLSLFSMTDGNTVNVPGIGETILFETPIIGFASADDDMFEVFRRKEVRSAN